jgi:hypothetical protein
MYNDSSLESGWLICLGEPSISSMVVVSWENTPGPIYATARLNDIPATTGMIDASIR